MLSDYLIVRMTKFSGAVQNNILVFVQNNRQVYFGKVHLLNNATLQHMSNHTQTSRHTAIRVPIMFILPHIGLAVNVAHKTSDFVSYRIMFSYKSICLTREATEFVYRIPVKCKNIVTASCLFVYKCNVQCDK